MLEAYEKSLTPALADIRYEGTLSAMNLDGLVFSVEEQAVTLYGLVDPRHIVLSARHSGAVGLARGLMDRFCALLEGMDIQEASDHGVIRLEHSLRDPKAPPPVPGVITPFNADPIFAVPQALIRKFYDRFLQISGAERSVNTWQPTVSKQWTDLREKARLHRIRDRVAQWLEETKVAVERPEVVEIRNLTRVVLSWRPHEKVGDLGESILALELWLKKETDFNIELVLEEEQDRNRRTRSSQRDRDALAEDATCPPP